VCFSYIEFAYAATLTGKKTSISYNVLLNMRDDATTKCIDNLPLALLIPGSFIFALDLAVP